MKTIKKTICVCSLGLSIFGLCFSANVLARDAQTGGLTNTRTAANAGVVTNTFVVESLGSATAADLYRVTCNARCVRADVNDAGPFEDTVFKVLVNGSSNGFTGNASRTNPAGSFSSVAEVCASTNTNSQRRAYISFTEVNAAGSENYDTFITCRTAAGALINPTIVKILDQ